MTAPGLRIAVISGRGGFLAPASTPHGVLVPFQREAARALEGSELHARLSALESQPTATIPEQLATFIRCETEKWGRVAKQAGIYRSQ